MQQPSIGDTFYASLPFLEGIVVEMRIDELSDIDDKGNVMQFVASMQNPVCEHKYVFPFRRTNKKKDDWIGVARYLKRVFIQKM